VLIQTLDLQEP